MTSEIDTNRRSLTPCLDENGVDDETVNDNSKEIELSDISDEEESSWNQCNKSDDEPVEGKPNGSNTKEATFKKITRNARERNYRDNVRRKSGSRNFQYQPPYRRFENKRKEIERYSVRNIIASREFTISRSQSRSFSPRPRLDSAGSKHSHRTRSFTPKRDIYRRRSVSPAYYGSSRYRSPVRKHRIPSRHSRSSSSLDMESYRSSEETPRRSRSRHKAEKNCSVEKSSKRRRKNKSKERRKHKKSRSESKRHSSSSQSLSPEPARSATSQTRQIINAPSLPQENIKVILKNEDAAVKKSKKRDKKNRKDKAQRKDMKEKKSSKDPPGSEVSKEVFASGDNILISVCFNNNNNTSKTTTAKSKEDLPTEQLVTTHKTKTKKRQQPPPVVASPVSSASLEESEKCQRKHKRKKVRIKNQESSVPASKCSIPPKPLPPINTKRKSDVKPIAIIDLEKSPGKEITQSPKEIIVLSDSDGETKKRDGTSKDVIIIEDMIVKKNTTSRGANQMPAGNLTPLSTPPESQPVSTQPVLKFALKSKSNVLPFNLLHDKAEEIEEQDASASSNTNNVNNEAPKIHQLKEMLETAAMDKNDNRSISSDDDEVYDPFEPTKSGSISPITPPPPNDVSSSSDMQKNKIESPMEKSTIPIKEIPQIPAIGSEEHLISSSSISIWSRKELDKKIPVTSNTPPLPPTFNAFSASSLQTVKQHVSLYDGIYGSDLKAVVSPTKPSIKPIEDKSASKMEHHDDEHTPYSPSSDGYNDFEPPPSTSVSHQPKNTFDSMKHGDMDAHNNDPGSSSSFTFSSNDDGPSKNVPLKLTASTLKTFNTLRSSGSHGLSFVNKNAFDNFLPTSQQVKSPLMKRQSSSSFLKTKMSRFTSSMNENGSPGMSRSYHHEIPKPTPAIDESMLDDEVPNSAVDLINRDRLLKKSLRIERVAEEVKLVLKPHYNKKNITKDEYKEILRKAVPKICHNKTGEINIQKIHALVEAYIKKFRYKRKSIGAGHVIASSI